MRRFASTAIVLLFGGLLTAALPVFAEAPAAPAAAPPVAAAVAISGEGLTPLTLGPAELAALPRVSVDAEDHGTRARFEGVPLAVLLDRAGAPLGEKLRHGKIALVVVVGAADGYRAVFALPELDPGFTDKVVILADRRDGQPLSAKEGPFRIVAVGEKRQGRWVRQVTSLTLKSVE